PGRAAFRRSPRDRQDYPRRAGACPRRPHFSTKEREYPMFQGFSGDTVDFLWGTRFNNERAWFEAHKEDYRAHLLAPMKELAAEVYDRFTEQCSDLALICKVSRIYRDARRLFGRGPYKDHLWLSIHRPEER